MSNDTISWSELAELTHATQVERFGWCACEDEGTLVYMDCPQEGEIEACTRCGQEGESDSLVSYGDWKLCELCQGDI